MATRSVQIPSTAADFENVIRRVVTERGGDSSRLYTQMSSIVNNLFERHPFSFALTDANVNHVLSEYLTMSRAFPYIQAAANSAVALNHVFRAEPVPLDVEATAVVGSFLVWDEFGGHQTLTERGESALSDILETRRFHSNILQSDLAELLGAELSPGNSQATLGYLGALSRGLSSSNPLERVANMAAFEMHAGQMIGALWRSLAAIFGEAALEKEYFILHAGGENPAEAYHIAMSLRLIDRAGAGANRSAELLDLFTEAYRLSFSWCGAVAMTSI
jgi:hypothetical protein